MAIGAAVVYRALSMFAAMFLILTPTVALSQDYGEWMRSERQSEMTDFMGLFFSLQSENTIPDSIGRDRLRPMLMIRCLENRTALLVNWGRFITTGNIYDQHSVRYRVDDREPVTAAWRMSTSYEATGLWRGSAIPLLRQMRGATRFIVETTPHGENAVLARFNVTGFDAVVSEVAERCSWSY